MRTHKVKPCSQLWWFCVLRCTTEECHRALPYARALVAESKRAQWEMDDDCTTVE